MNSDGRTFYKSLCILVGPIALQNLITAAVGAADVAMLNFVGQRAMAAASLAGQVQFVLLLFYVGLSSGLLMLTAQYWGKKDTASIETLAGIAFRLSAAVGLAFSVAAVGMPRLLMRVFTDEEPLIAEGAVYLRIVGVSYLFMAFSQVCQAVFKSVERVKTVTALTMVALGLNVLLNAVFIFGLFGAPKLGIGGVALATSISRAVEVFACVLVAAHIPEVRLRPATVFRHNAVLLRDFIHYAAPALGNEVVWGAAVAVYSVILGHLGEDIVAANSVASVIKNLAAVLCFGMAYGGAILLGKEMGSGDLERARRDAGRLWRSTVAAGLLGAVLIVALGPVVLPRVTLSPQATAYLALMLYINALSVFGAAVNTVLICGIFRAGGDARFGFVVDTIIMWCVSIPLGVLAARVFRLPPIWVYFVLLLDEFEKMPFVILHYRKGTWMTNITHDFSDSASAER